MKPVINSKATCDRLWKLRDSALEEGADLATIRTALAKLVKGLQVIDLLPPVPPGNVVFAVRTPAGGDYRFTIAEEIVDRAMAEAPKG